MKASVLALSLVFGVAHAASPVLPPPWPVPNIKAGPIAAQPVTGITIGAFDIKLEQTTFKDAASHLGIASVGQRGDASGFQMWVCYTLSAMHARLWLTSSELGGGEYINGFVVRREPGDVVAEPMCPAIAGVPPTTVTIDHGISLGSTENFVEATLGKPNEAPDYVVYYAYLGKDARYDVSSVLTLRIKNGVVTEIHAAHLTTD